MVKPEFPGDPRLPRSLLLEGRHRFPRCAGGSDQSLVPVLQVGIVRDEGIGERVRRVEQLVLGDDLSSDPTHARDPRPVARTMTTPCPHR